MVPNQDGQSQLMRWTTGRPASIIVSLALFLSIWIEMREGFLLLAEGPDLNGDGVFNFANLPPPQSMQFSPQLVTMCSQPHWECGGNRTAPAD